MTDATTPVRLLGLSGSLRRGSHCTAVLRTLGETLGGRAALELFPLNEIPLYDGDLDGEEQPAPVRALKAAIAGSDGLVVISPEYNYAMSGVLKNAIDWASRPNGKSPLVGKPAVIMTASPATTGGVRAQHGMREVLSACQCRVLARPQVVIAAVHQKVTEGRLTDEASLQFAAAAVDDLLREIHLLRQVPAAA
ncbi:NADPH-dependent FMN reductase [Roseomonas sp. BN140053]|uniref:NADPH-dependent FMN reductase n=1 Tax=Roseomonas sp. BN140053 TaxID=3391898 RepID=UPI0039ECB420